MSKSPNAPLKSIGLLAFLATSVVGWKLAAPQASVIFAGQEETKHDKRTPRSPRSIAADHAGQRVRSLRAIADPEARLLSTIALANSLSLDDFAAWMDGNWFTLRGGPERLVFNRILMERWRNEDPEGLLAWAAKNKNGAGDGVMQEWAANDPKRLVEYFKGHRDDYTELRILAKMAETSPAVALARLQEMGAGGLKDRTAYAASGLMSVLADKSPEALTAALDSLPPEVKLYAESMLSKKRLEESFSEEIRNLWARPDGWNIFSHGDFGNGVTEKLIGEIANLPPEWRGSMAMNYYRVVNRDTAQKWLNADLVGAGFSPSDVKTLRGQALKAIASQNPEVTLARLGEMELRPSDRREILEQVFSSRGDPGKLRGLISQLPTEEEREAATKRLEASSAPMKEGKANTPEDFLERLGEIPVRDGLYLNNFADFENWDAQKISKAAAEFEKLPGDKKQQVALTLASSEEHGVGLPQLKGDAILYLLQNPPAEKGIESSGKSLTAASAIYAVNLSYKDPEAATAWVEKLPGGEAKSWTQKNLYTNWKQLDPKAAEQWKKSLPAGELSAMEKLQVR